MGNCLTKCVQVKEEVDNGNEVGHSTEDCLHNPVIVRKILENFSSPELLKLSLVNKLWKYEARSVLAERGGFIAHVKSHDLHHRPTGKVDAFISDVKEMNPVPYSGISINIDFDPFNASAVQDPDILQGVILAQPSLKTVSVTLQGFWPHHVTCSAAMLTKKVMQDCNGVLEQLEVGIIPGRKHFMKEIVQDVTFPRLKILKLRDYWRLDDVDYENYIKALLSRAPNLKVLHSNWSVHSMLRVLEESSVQPVFGFVVAPFEGISENVFSAIQVENITLEYTGPEFDFQRFNRVTPLLLQQSCTTTLRSVRLDAVLAIPLMTYGICLENVDDLYMNIAYSQLELMEPRILRIVKNFNYSRIFPSLQKVSVGSDDTAVHDLSQDHMNALIDRVNAVLREPMPDRAARIKELDLHYCYPSTVAAQFYCEMFPSIEKLEITTSEGGQIPFGSIWNWLELKELRVRGDLLPTTGNLDSLFCGIFPEEVAELQLKDDEFLKKVNIVPVMPALTCLNKLTALSLFHENYRHEPFGADATFLFSKVAALIAFARQPTLEVTLIISGRSVPPAMDHLKPYVSVSTHVWRF